MAMTASQLRQNIYKTLDRVIETGQPVEIERNGRRLRITVDNPPKKLDRLIPRPQAVSGDSADFIHMDWSHEWKG
jgi:hypothetical protein